MNPLKVLWLSVFLMVLAGNAKAYVYNPTTNSERNTIFDIDDWTITSMILWDYTMSVSLQLRPANDWSNFHLFLTGDGNQFLETLNYISLVLKNNFDDIRQDIHRLFPLLMMALGGIEQDTYIIMPSRHYDFFQAFFIHTQPMVEAFIIRFDWK
ncbi:MAG: hypothetical protein FWE37_05825 [Spirochaetaceae bacterium]|nr:hypothetical protein [Spirochaetaceae bacterium]